MIVVLVLLDKLLLVAVLVQLDFVLQVSVDAVELLSFVVQLDRLEVQNVLLGFLVPQLIHGLLDAAFLFLQFALQIVDNLLNIDVVLLPADQLFQFVPDLLQTGHHLLCLGDCLACLHLKVLL